jgi:hypothetical protein
MRRRKAPLNGSPAPLAAAPAAAPPLVIDPLRVFTAQEFRHAFGLRASTLRREVRLSRLRIAKRGGKYYLFGKWILEWLESGEVRRGE